LHRSTTGTDGESEPDEPVVPAGAADDEFRNFPVVETLEENEVVDPLWGPLPVGLNTEMANRVFPTCTMEIQGHLGVDAPAAPSEQKFFWELGDGFHGSAEVAHQQDVAIHIAENVVDGDLLSPVEDAGEILGAAAVAANVWNLTDAQLAADRGGAFLVPEENEFDAGVEKFPTLQGVALDDGNLSDERLWRGEEGEHGV